nr:hypothetical protein [Tanacetum cinerariifolium]
MKASALELSLECVWQKLKKKSTLCQLLNFVRIPALQTWYQPQPVEVKSCSPAFRCKGTPSAVDRVRFLLSIRDFFFVAYAQSKTRVSLATCLTPRPSSDVRMSKRNNALLQDYKSSGKSSVFSDMRIGEQNEELWKLDKKIMRSKLEMDTSASKGFSHQMENKEVVVLEKNDDNDDGEKEDEEEEVIT